MTTLTNTTRSLRTTAPFAVGIVAAAVLVVGVGFWASNRGATGTGTSSLRQHQTSETLAAQAIAKPSLIERKLLQMDAQDDAQAARVATDRPSPMERKLLQMDAQDDAQAPRVATDRPSLMERKLHQMDAQDDAQAVRAAARRPSLMERKLQQMDAQDDAGR